MCQHTSIQDGHPHAVATEGADPAASLCTSAITSWSLEPRSTVSGWPMVRDPALDCTVGSRLDDATGDKLAE